MSENKPSRTGGAKVEPQGSTNETLEAQEDPQALTPAENHEAARQGNPASSSYNSANRQGAEAMRREAANNLGSEYRREQNEGKITDTPQRGAAGSGKHD